MNHSMDIEIYRALTSLGAGEQLAKEVATSIHTEIDRRVERYVERRASDLATRHELQDLAQVAKADVVRLAETTQKDLADVAKALRDDLADVRMTMNRHQSELYQRLSDMQRWTIGVMLGATGLVVTVVRLWH